MTKTTREIVLELATEAVMKDRNASYGKPEDNFGTIAKYWNVYLDSIKNRLLDSTDVAAMMSLMKHSRLATSPEKIDHWVDIAGYASCGAECAVKPNPEHQQLFDEVKKSLEDIPFL